MGVSAARIKKSCLCTAVNWLVCLSFHGALQVGVSAAARIKKSCLCLCTNGVSVDQWKYQFEMWTNIQASTAGAAAWIAWGYRARCQSANLQNQQLATPPAAHLCAAGSFAAGWKQGRVSAFVLPSCTRIMQKNQVCRFTSQTREWFESPAGVCITTYTMVGPQGLCTLLLCWNQCGIPAGVCITIYTMAGGCGLLWGRLGACFANAGSK